MTTFRIIGQESDEIVYYRVQQRRWLFFWKDLRIDSPFVEYETPSAEAADRTLKLYLQYTEMQKGLHKLMSMK